MWVISVRAHGPVAMEVSRPPLDKKSVKLEEAVEHIDGVLLPLFPELDDSGIDSDSTELLASSARQFGERHGHLNDVSSSDEDPMVKPWWERINKSKDDDLLKALEDGRVNPLEVNWPMGHRLPDLHRTFGDLSIDPDRASPPLYEVELTASDEDDDASVLELVIPMQPSRYKRVPTASPKKAKPKPKQKQNRMFYYNFICCMRK
ncbi:unnamed protein product [Diatraea saccharalis]|uniref:Uncharacterized protein n=1 Tax=Diatraea saccharalis TaxID=40085 RepID=A0A9N9RFN4_9NEOP|nr:unnamed protein product [Diatraea saccharalis]